MRTALASIHSFKIQASFIDTNAPLPNIVIALRCVLYITNSTFVIYSFDYVQYHSLKAFGMNWDARKLAAKSSRRQIKPNFPSLTKQPCDFFRHKYYYYFFIFRKYPGTFKDMNTVYKNE